jgi:hypothetical protein
MATGDLLYGKGQPEILKRVLVPPEDAAAEALKAYLARAKFTIHEGDPGVDEFSRQRDFCLEDVSTEWPTAGDQIRYPAATILGGDDVTHGGQGSPHEIAGTWNEVDRTVAWQIGIATGTFQVDFWTDSEPVRQAIAARLPGLFSPHEDRVGMLLELSPRYLCLAARYSLAGHSKQDTPDSATSNERRLRALVRWEVPDVVLRRAVPLCVRNTLEVETTRR